MRLFIAICLCRILWLIGKLVGKGTAKPGDIARAVCPHVLDRLRFDGKIICVTGTNGKTSSTLLLKQVLTKCLGAKVGLIGTMENHIGDEVLPTERTTPESFELQALFARMYKAGCTHVVMEVSSHAIALERIGGIHYDVAAFTNLTEDHLDFHKTMDDYCDAKAELFRRCSSQPVGFHQYIGNLLFRLFGSHHRCRALFHGSGNEPVTI